MGDPVILPRTDTGSVTGTSSRNAASATAGPACTSNQVDQQSHANNIGKAELEPQATAAPASVPTPILSFMARWFPAYSLAMIVAGVLAVIPVTSVVGVPLFLSLMGLGVGGLGVGAYEARDKTPPAGANGV